MQRLVPNPNGGIDWAQVRADNGHTEPYNVRYFEIGNEMNLGGEDGTASQEYWTKYAQNKGVEDAYIEGGTIQITDRYTVKEEDWNKTASQSDGSPNQVRYLRYANINPGGEYKDGKIIDDSKFRCYGKRCTGKSRNRWTSYSLDCGRRFESIRTKRYTL